MCSFTLCLCWSHSDALLQQPPQLYFWQPIRDRVEQVLMERKKLDVISFFLKFFFSILCSTQSCFWCALELKLCRSSTQPFFIQHFTAVSCWHECRCWWKWVVCWFGTDNNQINKFMTNWIQHEYLSLTMAETLQMALLKFYFSVLWLK